MNTQHNMEESLWNFIDGTISASEKIVVEKLLQTDADWKAKYGELLQVNELLQSSELEAPSLRFSKNVMEQISKLHIAPATKSKACSSAIRSSSPTAQRQLRSTTRSPAACNACAASSSPRLPN